LLNPYSEGLRARRPRFDSPQAQGIFPFSTASRTALTPTEPPIQWAPVIISPGIKRRVREVDHSSPSSVEFKNGGATPSLSPPSSWLGASLVRHRDNFTFTFLSIDA
jgi:hypothetical protein